MEYRKFKDTIVARLDPTEEITEQIQIIAEKENIRLASVQALGAVNDLTVGVYHVQEKRYLANHFQGDFEIVSLWGTINTMNEHYYGHFHISVANDQGKVFGGHLNQAYISATCEMIIKIIDGSVDRRQSSNGLNIYHFSD